jgi:hypothetical protein
MTFPIKSKVLEDILFGVIWTSIALWVLRILIIVSNLNKLLYREDNMTSS